MKIFKHIKTLAIACIFAPAVAMAQPGQIGLESVVKVPLDTIEAQEPGRYIILYTNNSWEYYLPELFKKSQIDILNNEWDTTTLFSYRNTKLEDIPDVVELSLVGELGDFHPPIVGRVFSRYGPRGRYRNHNGVDIPLKVGEPIYSTFDGRVRFADYNKGGYGYLVIVRHSNGLETYSGHLSRLNVKSGDYVVAGQVIGFGGNTGRSSGPHLHYEIRYKDHAFDPERLIDFEGGALRYWTFALEKGYFNIRSRASEELEEHYEDVGVSEILAMADDSAALRVASGRIEENKKSVPKKSAAVSQGAIYHTIKSGDMLSKLSVRYGVSVNQICRLNNITRTTILKLGRRLRIK